MSFVKNYLTNVCEIENFYDEDDAEKILEKFKKSQNWDHIIQKKPEHYSHVFKNDSIYMPDENEQYLSSFWRNDDLSNDQLIKEKTSLAIEKYFYELFKIKNLEIDIRCHKFMEKDFFRIHMDGYAGGYALTVSLNKRWKWDWGGILNILHGKDESSILGLLPKWNCANILNNNIHPSPHFVNSIQQYACEARYTITCFVKKFNDK